MIYQVFDGMWIFQYKWYISWIFSILVMFLLFFFSNQLAVLFLCYMSLSNHICTSRLLAVPFCLNIINSILIFDIFSVWSRPQISVNVCDQWNSHHTLLEFIYSSIYLFLCSAKPLRSYLLADFINSDINKLILLYYI